MKIATRSITLIAATFVALGTAYAETAYIAAWADPQKDNSPASPVRDATAGALASERLWR